MYLFFAKKNFTMSSIEKLKKLQLNKETIAILDNMDSLKGRGQVSGPISNPVSESIGAGCPPSSTIFGTGCDFHTIGHDDGSDCVSKTDILCWCGGF
jgi:hypothetical protein